MEHWFTVYSKKSEKYETLKLALLCVGCDIVPAIRKLSEFLVKKLIINKYSSPHIFADSPQIFADSEIGYVSKVAHATLLTYPISGRTSVQPWVFKIRFF